jgi:DHA2 family multidrug resistance protein
MIFFTYFARYGRTAILPEFTHGMLGYTATDSGLVLSPGSLVLLFFLPVTTWLMKRVDYRILVFSGLMVTTTAFFLLSRLSLSIDYRTIVRLRILESSGVALFLTPLSVLAYSQLKSGKNDAAASLYGLFRNLGSAIGISVVNTMLVRRVQVYRTYLAANIPAGSFPLRDTLNIASEWMRSYGGNSTSTASIRALGAINEQLNRQAILLTYTDCFSLLMWMSLSISPVAAFFVIRKRRSSSNQHC